MSAAFFQRGRSSGVRGSNIVTGEGRSGLRASNSRHSRAPPMSVRRHAFCSWHFHPSTAFSVRWSEWWLGLPFRLMTGTASMRHQNSAILFEGPGLGWFRHASISPMVPPLPWLFPLREKTRSSPWTEEDKVRHSAHSVGETLAEVIAPSGGHQARPLAS